MRQASGKEKRIFVLFTNNCENHRNTLSMLRTRKLGVKQRYN